MLFCALRTKDGEGPWLPCLQLAVMVDPDGEALCDAHLEQMWTCPDCEGFNVAGDGIPCASCQAAANVSEDGYFPWGEE